MNVVILGGPGDGPVVAEAIHAMKRAGARVALGGYLNDKLPKGTVIAGAPTLGSLEDWPTLPADTVFCPALHKVNQMHLRADRIRGLGIPDERWFTVVHPSACVARDVVIGRGTFIASFVTVQPGAQIGCFVSLRAGANIGHDATAGDFAYMGPNSSLCGRAQLQEGAHLGPNAAVLDGVRVGRYAVVGLCSAVTKNVDDDTVCFGVPGRIVSVDQMGGQ